jgi:DNA-binding NarL/FixJ family response regulator
LPFGLKTEQDIVDFIEVGANGYLLKHASFADLLQCIEAARREQAFCSLPIAASVSSRIEELAQQAHSPPDVPAIPVTSREREVLLCLADGLPNKEIAKRLGVRTPTVKNHVHNILKKLGAASRREAARRAYELGLLEVPSSWHPHRRP